MAFHPATGLVYIPARVGTQMVHVPDKNWKYDPDRDNVGIDGNYEGPLSRRWPSMPPPTGELLAWDPVAQKAVWRAKYPVLDGAGVLATGGNLIFQGRADGIFAAIAPPTASSSGASTPAPASWRRQSRITSAECNT